MAFLELLIPGEPPVKGRPRRGRNGVFYTPRETKLAEAAIAVVAREAMDGRPLLTGDVVVELLFVTSARKRKDGDNMLKLILDALNQVVWVDDSQVIEYHVFVEREGTPRTRLVVRERNQDAQERRLVA